MGKNFKEVLTARHFSAILIRVISVIRGELPPVFQTFRMKSAAKLRTCWPFKT